MREGDPGYSLYLIVSGRVRVQRESITGVMLHIADLGHGEQVGEMALIDGEARSADVVTIAPTEVVIVDRADFLQCMERSFSSALAVMSSLAQRLRRTAATLESQRTLNVIGRVARVLLEDAGIDRRRLPTEEVVLSPGLTGQKIANQVGSKRETVSRAISTFKSAGALRSRGRRLIIVDAAALWQYRDN